MLAVLQARMSSTRLPGKVLKDLIGRPMIERQMERLHRAGTLSHIVVATSTGDDDDAIAGWCDEQGLDCYRGALDDVLGRFLGALESRGWPEHFVRLTADCPLADPTLIDAVVNAHLDSGSDYTHAQDGRTYPKGLDVEVCRTSVLRDLNPEAVGEDREHVTRFIYTHPDRYRIHVIKRDPPLRYRWTVDTPADFAFVEAVYTDLYPANPAFTTEDVLAWQAAHPDKVLVNDEV